MADLYSCLRYLTLQNKKNIPLINKLIKKIRVKSEHRLTAQEIYKTLNLEPAQIDTIRDLYNKQVQFEQTLEGYGLVKKEFPLGKDVMSKVAEFILP